MSVYGNFLHPDLPFVGIGAGIRTHYGHIMPPMGRVAAYVCSAGARDGDDQALKSRLVPTLAAALSYCRAGRGDVVYVLPGHSENVGTTMMSNLVAGTKIIGLGDPDQDDAPTFTWSATTSKWTIAAKNVTIAGLRLVGGANGVTEGIEVSAAGFKFIGNHVRLADTASLEFTSFMDLASGANNATIHGNEMIGLAASNASVVAIAAAVARPKITSNLIISHSSAATNGSIHITAAATEILIADNVMHQKLATGTCCVRFADVAATGFCVRNLMAVENDGTASAQGFSIAGTTNLLVKFAQNYTVDEAGLSAILAPGVAT